MLHPDISGLGATPRPYFSARFSGGRTITDGSPHARLGHRLADRSEHGHEGIFVEWDWDGGALTVTWALNRRLTFSPSSRGPFREGSRYGGVGFASSLFNYLVYSSLLLVMPTMPPLGALAVASLAAMAFSFLGYTRLVFDR